MLFAAALPIASFVSPAAAQQEEIGGAFVDTLDVQAVNVEVVVTDRKGNRVTDLKAGDFRLLVDGQPVPVDYFAEIREGHAVAPPAEPGEGPVALPPALTDVEAGDEVGTNYLVFIDEFFSPYKLRNEALKVLARDISTLGPRDRMAVVAFEGMRLRVVADWSEPSPALAETLRQTARHKGYLNAADLGGIRDLRPLRQGGIQTPSSLNKVDSFLTADDGLQPGDMEADRSESTLARKVLIGAAGALRTLEPPPGRKVALILSGGWKLDPRASTNQYDQIQEYLSWGDPLALLRPLTDEANRLGYTVYPIHLADTPLPSAGDRTIDKPVAFSMADASLAEAVRQGSLVFAAEETGGRLLRPGAAHLKRIEDDTRSYYWLGFTNSTGDNKRRTLKVEILRDGLKVRSRSSFVPLSRPARAAISIEGALVTGRDLPGAKPLDVEVGTPEERSLRTKSVPLAFRLPAEAITLLPEEGRLVARLEVWMTAIDENGRRSDLVVTPAALAVDEMPAPGKKVVYRSSIVVRPGKQDVMLAVVDTASGETFSTRLKLDI
jgi:VWFA-related protein